MSKPRPGVCSLTTLADDIVVGFTHFEGCAIRVPSTPGLGLTLDEEKIVKYRV